MSSGPGSGQRVGVVIVAAGESQRMDGVDKVRAPLRGRPLISYSLETFDACPRVQEVVLVLGERNLAWGEVLVREMGWKKVVSVSLGGARRQDSVRLGLSYLSVPIEWVMVHDGARPCIDSQIIERGLDALRAARAAVSAVPVKDTIKVVDVDQMVMSTPDRDRLWAVQTPQLFYRAVLEEAHRRVQETVTDDGAMVERIGCPVKVFLGSYSNIKVTTVEDLILAEAILRRR